MSSVVVWKNPRSAKSCMAARKIFSRVSTRRRSRRPGASLTCFRPTVISANLVADANHFTNVMRSLHLVQHEMSYICTRNVESAFRESPIFDTVVFLAGAICQARRGNNGSGHLSRFDFLLPRAPISRPPSRTHATRNPSVENRCCRTAKPQKPPRACVFQLRSWRQRYFLRNLRESTYDQDRDIPSMRAPRHVLAIRSAIGQCRGGRLPLL